MTYAEVIDVVRKRPNSVTAFLPVVKEDGERGLFWGTFALSYRDVDMTEEVAADLPQRTRGMAALVALARTRREALDHGLQVTT